MQNPKESAQNLKVGVKTLGHKSFIAKVLSGPDTGKTVFLEDVVPGEECEVQIIKDQKKFAEAKLVKLLQASPDRIEPSCKFFDSCGGCSLQHMELEKQRQLKLELVEETFTKKAKIFPTNGFIDATKDLPGFNYRNRIRLHVNKNGKLAFFQKNSRDYVDIDRCLIAKDSINEVLSSFPQLIQSQIKLLSEVEFALDRDAVWTVFYLNQSVGSDKLREIFAPVLKGLRFWRFIFKSQTILSSGVDSESVAGSFSQVNLAVNQKLQSLIVENVNAKSLTELYSGSGNFTFDLLANKPDLKIIAVESANALVKHAKTVARKLDLEDRVKFYALKAEEYTFKHEFVENLLLDPPRAGAKEALNALENAKVKPKEILYVSCYLPTLIRDLEFLQKHSYILDKVYVFDMFPQTYHVELLALLKLS